MHFKTLHDSKLLTGIALVHDDGGWFEGRLNNTRAHRCCVLFSCVWRGWTFNQHVLIRETSLRTTVCHFFRCICVFIKDTACPHTLKEASAGHDNDNDFCLLFLVKRPFCCCIFNVCNSLDFVLSNQSLHCWFVCFVTCFFNLHLKCLSLPVFSDPVS